MAIIPSSLPRRVSFMRAGFRATIYNHDGTEILHEGVPLIQVQDADVRVDRGEGVVIATTDLAGLIPMRPELGGGERVLVRDVRLGEEHDRAFRILELETNSERRITGLGLESLGTAIDG